MEIKMEELQLPAEISFNYEETKAELLGICETYETAEYTDMKKAKADKAMLNSTKKALNDFRIKKQKEYMRPFDEFKAKVDNLIDIIGRASNNIDIQVKAAEEKERTLKQLDIEELFQETVFPHFVALSKIMNPKWMNKTYSLKQIGADMAEKKAQIERDMATIAQLEHPQEAEVLYEQTLDINEAIQESARLVRIAEEAENRRQALEALKKAQEEAKAAQPINLPSELENAKEEASAASEKHIKRLRISFTVEANEAQFAELNEALKLLRAHSDKFTITSKEEI